MVKSGTKGKLNLYKRTANMKDRIRVSLNWRFKCTKTQWSWGKCAASHFTETSPLDIIGILLPKRVSI